MRLYASNARISRSALRYARLNRPMNPFDLTPRSRAKQRRDPRATAPALTTSRGRLFTFVRTLRSASR